MKEELIFIFDQACKFTTNLSSAFGTALIHNFRKDTTMLVCANGYDLAIVTLRKYRQRQIWCSSTYLEKEKTGMNNDKIAV